MTVPGKGTRDLSGPSGLTTVDFVKEVRNRIENKSVNNKVTSTESAVFVDAHEYDKVQMKKLFDQVDTNKSGTIDFNEFCVAMKKLGIAPTKENSEKLL